MPSTWPVISLSAQPRTCVTFTHHAVYLGTPGADMACPANGAGGNVGAILVQPASAVSAIATAENPVSHMITTTAPRIHLTASYGTDEAVVQAVITSASLPAPTVQNPSAAAAAQAPVSFAAAQPAAAAGAPAEAAQAAAAGPAAGNDIGEGFDTCSAPSSAAMSAWRSSTSYRLVGIYIGGEDRACDQPNLTASWVSQQARAGWHFLPLYVGAEVGQLTSPASQGTQQAEDAVREAKALGLGLGTPLYYDVEGGFGPTDTAVLSALTAWTNELHKLGYESGVYSNAAAGVALLVDHYSSAVMPDVIFDAHYNGADTPNDPAYIPAGDWASDQRVHQWAGNVTETHGGVTMAIDRDASAVRLPYGGSRQASQATAQQSGTVDVFFEGSGGSLERTDGSASTWTKPANMNAGRIGSEPSVVTSRPGDVDVFWKGTDSHLWYDFYRPGAGWSGARRIGSYTLGGAPYAVAQQDGTIDVFWKGTGSNPSLWRAWQNAGSSSWSGPQKLGGSLASDPSPVTASPGTVDVFFEGSDHGLWEVLYTPASGWHSPVRLAMGLLGSAPHATGQLDGAIDVFWESTGTSPGIKYAWSTSGTGWHGPLSLGGSGEVDSAPFAVSSAPGTVEVFFRGVNGHLYWAYTTSSGSWHGPASIGMGVLGGAPFAAAAVSGAADVFWKGTGTKPALWHAWLASGTAWHGPQDVGGVVQ